MRDILRRLLANPLGLSGSIIVLGALLLAVVGPALAPFDPTEFHPRNRFASPGSGYLLGTDQFGRDILSRMMWGARSTVIFGVTATLLGTALGACIGMIAGYLGGATDEVVMRLIDAKMAVPNLLFTLLILTVLGPNATNAMIAVAIAFTPSMARIMRSVVLSERTRDYVSAARARGESARFIMFREILPNVAAPIVVESSIRVAFAIMLGATLSYLGLGAQPPTPDWGIMVAEARAFLQHSPWLAAWPGLGIAIVAVGFNLLGDGLRDALNPRVDN
ncbi:MAG: ABC transporter permease [Ramlibacter sp.]|nr:ABC transporter permease [Ramlibacter sp.]